MLIWKKRLNDYGLSDPIIIFLIFIAMLAVAAEMVSIGIFLPLFEFINQYGVEGIKKSESDMVKYVYDFFELTGFNLTIEILLISSFILFLLSKILLYMINYIQSYYTGLMSKNMKDQLLDNYLMVESSYYDTVGIGNFTNNSSVELPVAVNGVMLPIKLTITAMSGIGSIILLSMISPQLTLVSICVAGIGVLLPIRWVKATTKVGRKNSQYGSIVTSFLLNRLESPRLVRLSNTAYTEKENYSLLTEKHRKLTLSIHILKARITLVLEPMIIGISLLMFYIALVFLKMQVSAVLLYMVVIVRIVPIVTNLMTQKQGINRSIGPIQAIDKLLIGMNKSIDNRKKNIPNKTLMNKINIVEKLRLENIIFCYARCSYHSLFDINHTFYASTLTAIVGPSGSGKTTFIDIISGYRQPTSGAIFVNEINTDKYNSESLMSLVSYVPQEPQIFDGITVYEHIAYGRPNSTKEEVINASKLSGAYDFIKELPQEFDTVLVGKSSGLSGGQKQRLDLSRALLRDTPILIMDEPTGNLDLISEKDLMSSINKIRLETGKIIIIIAHRIYTIMDADRIIVLEDGNISGAGTHSELLLSNSWYKQAVSELHFGN
jgi:ABC-type multidrug transport system fused ATPase/permease subunit